MSDSKPIQSQPPIVTWQIPLVDEPTLSFDATLGEVVTIVGANGSGKSALATRMAKQVPPDKLRRVLPHRKLWFQNSGPDISASSRESMSETMSYYDTSPDSRFMDHADGQRTSIALFDLLGKIAAEDHRIAELSQTYRRTPKDIDAIIGDRLFDVLNSVFEKAGLLVQIKTTDKQTFSAFHKERGVEYPIAKMSDGERSALLLSAEVLVAQNNSVIIVDEPERHLHRSISAGLIEALTDIRTDCSFVVLTHDLELGVDLSKRPGKVLVTLGVESPGDESERWKIQEITTDAPITESARRGILGGRRQVLFIEGKEDSPDYTLYRLLFPGWTLMASGGCEWVIRSVEGIRTTQGEHWVRAAGIVDGDGRSKQEREALTSKKVYPLAVSEVESLYYLPAVLCAVAAKLETLDGGDAKERICIAKSAGISALAENNGLKRIAEKLARDQVSRTIVAAIVPEITNPEIQIDIPSPYEEIKSELDNSYSQNDYENLVRIASIRDSAFRNKVAMALGAKNANHYEKIALHIIAEDSKLASLLREEITDKLVEVDNGY